MTHTTSPAFNKLMHDAVLSRIYVRVNYEKSKRPLENKTGRKYVNKITSYSIAVANSKTLGLHPVEAHGTRTAAINSNLRLFPNCGLEEVYTVGALSLVDAAMTGASTFWLAVRNETDDVVGSITLRLVQRRYFPDRYCGLDAEFQILGFIAAGTLERGGQASSCRLDNCPKHLVGQIPLLSVAS